MREIKMKSISAGPGGVRPPGSVHTLPKEEAKALVDGKYAEYTTVEPEETTDGRPQPRRGRPLKGDQE